MVCCKVRFGPHFLGRGWGFGNRLFPWARCRVYAQLHGLPVIDPIWIRPAVAQFWRGGIDRNSYLRQLVLAGLFKRRDGDIGRWSGAWYSMRGTSVSEPADLSRAMHTTDGRDHVIVFDGLRDYFAPLDGWADFLLEELKTITRPRFLALADAVPAVPVGMCVRLGNDVPPGRPGAMLRPGEKAPVEWFVRSLAVIRQAAGFRVPAYVVSDGSERQLAPLLGMGEVTFVRPGSAISDLLILAKSQLLVVSGSSSFAAWGVFLGQVPAVSHPGQPLGDWGFNRRRSPSLWELDPEDPSPDFLAQARHVLGPERPGSSSLLPGAEAEGGDLARRP